MTPSEQSYCEIVLSDGQIAKVSPEDFPMLSRFSWQAMKKSDNASTYAVRCIVHQDGRQHFAQMHRQILGLQRGERKYTDHINHDTLDNRRENLRLVTTQQNNYNLRKPRTNTSGFKGVSRSADGKKWRATISVQGKFKHLGVFDSKEEAYAAYCKIAAELGGEYACFE